MPRGHVGGVAIHPGYAASFNLSSTTFDHSSASGASRHLKPERLNPPWEKLRNLRERAGTTNTRSQEEIEDYSVRGLGSLLQALPTLDVENRHAKAEILWEALSDLEQFQRGVFTGKYQGQYYGRKQQCEFEVDFIERLNNTPWVTDPNGRLERPEFVIFGALGWKPNPFLLSKISFKPSIIETLAKEAGIEPGLLDLLKKLGLTNEAEFLARLGIKDPLEMVGAVVTNEVCDRVEKSPGKTTEQMPSVPVAADLSSDGAGGAGETRSNRDGREEAGEPDTRVSASGRTDELFSEAQEAERKRTPGSTGRALFISYVAVGPDEEEQDPDGLDQQTRMDLEEKAIQRILQREPQLQRTPAFNPGYDLFEASEDRQPIRWMEVKAMTRDLRSRPVGLSRTQFDYAREHGEAYWLYVVEHAK